MPYYEYEHLMDDIHEIEEREKEERENDDKKYSGMTPKMPNFSNMGSLMPKISIPKF